jgi:ketosteroid isomerase-like protein
MKTLLPLFLLLAFAQQSVSPELQRLADTERAFSRTSVEKGIRASFTEFFAEDGINFTPNPGNAQQYFRNRPAPTAPQPFTLKWEPAFADVSQAGELGYTTGPVINTDNANQRPARYSYYFSVWKKQPDNNWKVLLDLGTSTPEPSSKQPVFVGATPGTWRSKQAVDVKKERRQLLDVESELSTATQKGNVSEALSKFLADETRMHRDETFPLVGQKAIADYIVKQNWTSLSYEPIDAGVSQSADLGYTYGKYSLTKKDVAKVEQGYIVRVWKRNNAGNWKLVADIANALPDE